MSKKKKPTVGSEPVVDAPTTEGAENSADVVATTATAPKRKYTHFEKQVLSVATTAHKEGAAGAAKWLRARGRDCFDLSATGRAYGKDLPAFKAELEDALAASNEKVCGVGATPEDAAENEALNAWLQAVAAVEDRIANGGRAGEKAAKALWKVHGTQKARKPRAKKVKAASPPEAEAPTSDEADAAPSEDAAAAA